MKQRPAIKLPKNTVISASLGSKTGKVDRVYLRAMARAIDDFNRHKNASMRKLTRDASDVEV